MGSRGTVRKSPLPNLELTRMKHTSVSKQGFRQNVKVALLHQWITSATIRLALFTAIILALLISLDLFGF